MNTGLMKNLKKKKKGFTLIELIIVIAILAILAALALPKFGAVKNTANVSADKATAKNIQTTVAKMIAEDQIPVGTAITTTKLDSAETTVSPKIDGSLDPKLKKFQGGHFTYAVDASGNVTVGVEDSKDANPEIIYPTAGTDYK